MENFDVIKVLGYGLSGLSFLLIFMTFSLIRSEQNRPKPRREILGTIRMFMLLVLLCVIVVGIFSIPTLRDNDLLKSNNDALSTENLKVTSQLGLQESATILEEKSAEISSDSVVQIVEQQVQQLDTLSQTVTNEQQKTDIEKLKENLHKDIEALKTQNNRFSGRDARKLATYMKKISKDLDKVIDVNNRSSEQTNQ
ncbi:MAG: hypothetical protein NW226_19530 [Microscillaceae bacterium]|nr:hypothetical protein [Microscillaceae bacterium]